MRIYRALMRLYPADFRAWFAAEMLEAFDSAAAGWKQSGKTASTFVISEIAGLTLGATREWIVKLTSDRTVRGRLLPDLRFMRPPGISREVWFR